MNILLKTKDHTLKTLIVFGLLQLVFGSIISTGMNILPKTKDHTLKTLIVFGLWWLVFGLIISTGMNILPKTKDPSLKTGAVFCFSLRIFFSRQKKIPNPVLNIPFPFSSQFR
jgi:uncharacterized membrane protein